MQTAQQKKREQVLDKEWVEDLVWVHQNIHDCDEIDFLLEKEKAWWNLCPLCGATIKDDGSVEHRKQ